MPTYRTLTPEHFSALYKCFVEAFSDYVVKMELSIDEFHQRLTRDGVELEMSVGAFDDSEMVGFSLNAIGKWRALRTAYDAGTGVLPSHRRVGVGKSMFAYMIEILRAHQIEQCLLEVITTNSAAVGLYKGLGFEETRRLAVLRADEQSQIVHQRSSFEIRQPAGLDWTRVESFWDGYPSWQNAIAAAVRAEKDCRVLCAYSEQACIGYGIVFRPSSLLMQLAVDPDQRRRGIGTAILGALQQGLDSGPIKINNVDCKLEESLRFFKAQGYKVILDQFEMTKRL